MKYIKPILLCILTGILMGFFLYSGYERKKEILPVFKEDEKITFFRIGIYDGEEAMEKNMKDFKNYIYLIKENKYYAYIGMVKESANKEKIKEYYKKKGYIIDEELFMVESKSFLSVLQKYEEMLKETNEDAVIENIINGILQKYEEMVKTV